jgi:Flp pilus assembly pilin Flp
MVRTSRADPTPICRRVRRLRGSVTRIHSATGRLAGGQGIVEYGLILSLSAALAAILLVFFGGTVSAVLEAVGNAIDAAS